MNAVELFLADGKPASVWFCGKCRHVAGSQHLADLCCDTYKCNKCGKDTGSRSWLRCEACRDAEDVASEVKRFEAAKKVTAWDGWVYSEGHGYKDGYFESLDDFKEWADDERSDETPLPTYVWTCKSEAFAQADIDSILCQITDNGYEDFDPETLDGIPELKAALEAFNEANKDVLSYTPDYSTAVLFTQQNDMAEGGTE